MAGDAAKAVDRPRLDGCSFDFPFAPDHPTAGSTTDGPQGSPRTRPDDGELRDGDVHLVRGRRNCQPSRVSDAKRSPWLDALHSIAAGEPIAVAGGPSHPRMDGNGLRARIVLLRSLACSPATDGRGEGGHNLRIC